jgi:hypothetical protein
VSLAPQTDVAASDTLAQLLVTGGRGVSHLAVLARA